MQIYFLAGAELGKGGRKLEGPKIKGVENYRGLKLKGVRYLIFQITMNAPLLHMALCVLRGLCT